MDPRMNCEFRTGPCWEDVEERLNEGQQPMIPYGTGIDMSVC